jgi:hypothetical protein
MLLELPQIFAFRYPSVTALATAVAINNERFSTDFLNRPLLEVTAQLIGESTAADSLSGTILNE